MLFSYRLHTWYQNTTQKGTFNVPKADDLDLQSRSKVKVKISQKVLNNWAISQMLFHHTDFILVTNVQHNKVHSMTQVLMIFAEGQDQRSRSNLSIMSKKLNNLLYLGSYFTYRLHT